MDIDETTMRRKQQQQIRIFLRPRIWILFFLAIAMVASKYGEKRTNSFVTLTNKYFCR